MEKVKTWGLELSTDTKFRLAEQVIEDPKTLYCWGKITTMHLRNSEVQPAMNKIIMAFKGFKHLQSAKSLITLRRKVFKETFLLLFGNIITIFFFFSLQNSFLPVTKRNCRTAYWVGRERCFSLPLKGTTYWSDDSEVSWLHQGSWLCGGREKEKKGGKIIQKMLHRKHFSWLILIWKQQLPSAK